MSNSELLTDAALFDRVAAILEESRRNAVRAVNSNMVIAYWLIGREIVQALQGGEDRAEYGKGVIEALSARLTSAYGKGFSAQSLWNFRRFYQTFPERYAILSPLGRELASPENPSPAGRESVANFSPPRTWSHNRTLVHVQNEQFCPLYKMHSANKSELMELKRLAA